CDCLDLDSSHNLPQRYFSIARPPNPRHLHSFPTRRSSDLQLSCGRPGISSVSYVSSNEVCQKSCCRTSFTKRAGRMLWGCCHDRSEEHTSELQSRGHLVCRLLLEKKNAEREARSYSGSIGP